ncbi:methyltransferase C-terminal domain-containing protein [Isoptericola sp. NEAU-Y5]|uniref:Methyltransferase C-terminal domain-containing protein n=1 Tax=Isoptericola luteus TaxID=2879484 RepID=A0ABS7ZGF6_9MICO|nr:methyltransferase domain-containing protein [Isoptericola sp. NEAU-Y5]MCA5892895.1 methyltransferase C-terminal domain-containing protein [Isoptericola sp. NEAU-Y5]
MPLPPGSRAPVAAWRCRWCRSADGEVVLDLGAQPPAGLLPLPGDPLPDPTHPLRLVLCASCGLAQLEEDGPAAREEAGVEPQAMVAQGRTVVRALADAGLLAPGATFAQFPSPHGGDWGGLLEAAGAVPWTSGGGHPDLVLDIFGLMHDADVATAWDERVRRLAPGSVLVVQYHSLAGDLAAGAWHTLRPGHYGYLSAPVLVAMARARGLRPCAAWTSDLQGGTGVLAFERPVDGTAADLGADAGAAPSFEALVQAERVAGVEDPRVVATLDAVAGRAGAALREYVARCRARGLRVGGYGAASRTPVILTLARLGADDVVAVADASPGKQGRCLPVGRVPVVAPGALEGLGVDRVVLFVPELLDEVRRACPFVEARGGRWVVLDPHPVEVPPVGGGARDVDVAVDVVAGRAEVEAVGRTTRGTR